MKNRSSLHSIWDFVFKTRGSFSSGRGGQFAKGRRGSLCSGISNSYTNYLIEKAVERTKILEINGGTDVKAPYYIQQDYIIPQEKELLTNGASFCFHFSLDSLDKYKALHRKYARAMKATQILSADDYTAFIWNGGKNVCVYYYNVRDTESLK